MSSHESATPIRILHNSAGHLAGSARTLGGVVIGYLGKLLLYCELFKVILSLGMIVYIIM